MSYDEILKELIPTEQSLADVLASADQAIRRARSTGKMENMASAIEQTLRDQELAPILEMALQQIASTEPQLVALIRDEILPSLYRLPIGERLAASA